MSDEKNKYITAYGSSNADSYGRGDVTDVSTKYNMLTTNPLSDENAPEMNSYSSDGSYNQDIFGWKCFNSPVSFRNGIYGECGAVVTSDEFYFYGGRCGITSDEAGEKSGVTISNYGAARVSCGRAILSKLGSTNDSDSVYIKSSKGNCEAAIHVASTKWTDGSDFSYYSTVVIKSDTIHFQLDNDNYFTIEKLNGNNNIFFTGDSDWDIGSASNGVRNIYADKFVGGIDLYKSNNAFDKNSVRFVKITLVADYTSENPPIFFISAGSTFTLYGGSGFSTGKYFIDEIGDFKKNTGSIGNALYIRSITFANNMISDTGDMKLVDTTTELIDSSTDVMSGEYRCLTSARVSCIDPSVKPAGYEFFALLVRQTDTSNIG